MFEFHLSLVSLLNLVSIALVVVGAISNFCVILSREEETDEKT